VVGASWIDWPTFGYRFGRTGFYWAAACLSVLLIVHARGDDGLRLADLQKRRAFSLACAGAALALAWAAPVIWAHARTAAFLEAVRVATCLVFLGVVSGQLRRREKRPDEQTADGLAALGIAFVLVNAAVLVVGMVSSRLGTRLFERAPHFLVGQLPRFRGWMPQPMACGSTVLAAMGLAAMARHTIVRRAAFVVGCVVVGATFSFAALTLPFAVWRGFALGRRIPKVLQLVVSGGLVIIPCLLLWVKPTYVGLGSRVLYDDPPPPSYFTDDRGTAAMPIHTLAAGPFRLFFHLTAYGVLGIRAATCLGEHPWGVGGRNFVYDCPVLAMNTIGQWKSDRSAHNAYAALLAEGGPLAVAATIAFLLVAVRRLRLRRDRPLARGLLFAFLLAGWGGASPFQFPMAALLAVLCRWRSDEPPAGELPGAQAADERTGFAA